MQDNMLRMKWWEKRSRLGLRGFNEQLNPCQQPPDFLLCEEIKTLPSLSCCYSDILLTAAKAFLSDAFITEEK